MIKTRSTMQSESIYHVRLSSGASRPLLRRVCSAGISSGETRTRRNLPLAIPRAQLYYWTRLWRDGVASSRQALVNGDFVEFDSDDPTDIVRWLNDAADEDG